MNRFQYPVRMQSADEGGYVVTCRDLPELITQGEDVGDALEQAADAMDEVFATYLSKGLDIPEPSKPRRQERLVAPPVETVAKAALYVAMRQAGVSKTQLAKRLGVDEKEVRRLLDPHYGSKLPRIAKAISLLGQRLVIGVETV
ncbi:MAG TPA: type II toxin-antitoxin system HicB family antitoxin [Burkholderiaceae bacterium]|nr:type II toxin-antitoxin system HicB family antitoxin [Burkholderiaceae bacterium]